MATRGRGAEPFLIPFALLIQLVNWVGRGLMEQLKPIVTEGDAAPGEIGNIIFPPLAAIALWFALPRKASSLPAQ